MANYAYVSLKGLLKGPTGRDLPRKERMAVFLPILSMAVQTALDSRWHIALADFEDEGPTWLVTIPGTAKEGREANMRMLAPGEDVGFPVTLQKGQIAFRHSPNLFTGWAQGCVQEQLADHFDRGVFYDATDETIPPGTHEYRRGKTFREYLERNWEKPLSSSTAAFIDRQHKAYAPEGF